MTGAPKCRRAKSQWPNYSIDENRCIRCSRLPVGGRSHSPERALGRLRRIQHHLVPVNDSQSVTGLPSCDQTKASIRSGRSNNHSRATVAEKEKSR